MVTEEFDLTNLVATFVAKIRFTSCTKHMITAACSLNEHLFKWIINKQEELKLRIQGRVKKKKSQKHFRQNTREAKKQTKMMTEVFKKRAKKQKIPVCFPPRSFPFFSSVCVWENKSEEKKAQ